MDHKGWFERITKEKNWMTIQDIIFVSAMGPPGGGRSFITPRLLRHYNIITYTELDSKSISMIFNTILSKFLGGFEQEVSQQVSKIVESTQTVYKNVEVRLKPTPIKSHYTFNLRDISKIFQGVCSAHSKTIVKKDDLLRLWYHEAQRVFGDRMVSNKDKEILDEIIFTEAKEKFQSEKE
jgi:dynein heavy chain